MTAARRREQDRREHGRYLRGCPTTQLLDRIGNRWSTLAICALGETDGGALRYSEISRHIPGVSQKMLTQTLRALERDGIVERTVTPSVPVRVDYALTDLGRSLYGLLLSMQTWADEHIDAIKQARTQHDARAAGE